jgi:hypothetical protein
MTLETTTITGRPNASLPLTGNELVIMDQGGTTPRAKASDVAKTLPAATPTTPGQLSATDKTRLDQLGADDSPTFAGLTVTGSAAVVIPHIHGSIAGNFYIHVRNTSGGSLAAGTAVYATGSVGDTDRITVSACDPTDPAKMPAIGILETTLANNGDGDALREGELRPFNTSGFLIRDRLYVGAGGALTATLPASGLVQSVGSVARVNVNTGTILVAISAPMARAGFTGDYDDLTDKPTIPSLPGVVTTSAAGLQPATSFGTITYGATVALDLADLNGEVNTITLTGNLELTTSNLANGQRTGLRLIPGASVRTLTFPTDWKFVSAKPATLPANKIARLSIECHGTTNADVIAAIAIQP